MEGSSGGRKARRTSEEPPVRSKIPSRGREPDKTPAAKKAGSSSSSIKPRPYQVELLEDALCENTIVNLGTGAGKTFIAVMLIRELSFQILDRPFFEHAKRTIFLVCTVPLVKQQAEYLKAHTLLDVGQYIGAMNVDSWSREQWTEQLSSHHVLVMTHTIFKNLLHSGYLHLRNVNLLVFDECHHAVKNHDYVQIMKVFDSVPEFDDHPRVLGLSASLLNRKIKPGQLVKLVKELETTLKCRCQTARDYEDVALHATDPDEKTLVYSSQPLPHLCEPTIQLREIVVSPLEFLESLPRDQREDTCYRIAKASLDDTLHILENLGIWCALNCAEQCREGLTDKLSSSESLLLEPKQMSLLELALTHIEIFLRKARELYKEDDIDVTYKVQQLLECLKEQLRGYSRASGGAERKKNQKMLGIVFVERRMTALLLKRMLDRLTPNIHGLSAIRCDYIVGHNAVKGFTTLRQESQMNVKKQEEVLARFRKEKINLLIATSVVEEGIDVPRCNLVIRFDFPPNLRSYIQSKGRARARPSNYILMIEDLKAGKARSDLRDYGVVERELKTLCRNRNPPEDEEFLEFLQKRECNIYAPYGLEAGIRATLSSSLSFLYKYCQKFSDKFSSFSPIFERESRLVMEDCPELQLEAGEREFRSTVQLPISCPVRDKITGHWMPKSSRIADKSAALQAIRVLHERNELDKHLKPVTIDPDSDNEEEERERGRDKHSGTEKRAKYYRDEVPTSLRGALPVAGSGNYLYIILMEEADSDILKFPFSRQPPHGPHRALGVLSRNPLPHKQIPEFSIYEKRMEIRVSLEELSTTVATLSEVELGLLQQCHQALFESVLRLKSPLLSCSFSQAEPATVTATSEVLVVPINLWQLQSPPLAHINFVAHINFEMAERVVRCGTGSFPRLEWPFPVEDTVVTKVYQDEGGLLEVLEVNEWVTPDNKFPSDKYASYMDYFLEKYKVQIQNLAQPALECKKIGFSDMRLNLLKSRYKDTHGAEMDTGAQGSHRDTETLFPEITQLYPLPASFVKVVRCLPSILFRIESLLHVNDLRSEVTLSTGVGAITTTKTDLRGYKDYGLGRLQTHWDLDSAVPACPCSDDPVIVRGPGNALLLQAMTLKSATDFIDNERLETLGDSFLKLATSVFLFCERPNAHEGRLTSARTRRIGNWNLFQLAKRREMIGKTISRCFQPTGSWVPPCFSFSGPTTAASLGANEREGVRADKISESERQYLYHRVTDKGVADFVESLIGAYLVAGGMEAALRFMKWIGLKICRQRHTGEDQEMIEEECEAKASSNPLSVPRSKRSRQSPEAFSEEDDNLLIHRSPEILQHHFGPPPPSLFDPSQTEAVSRLLACSVGSIDPDQIIRWRFRDKALLLQAITHASYQRNRVTDCYQRLEFLGDAVLDYLITTQIYERFPNFDPGKITDMRSALVNNNLFAELAVGLRLHKLLRHQSPVLFRLIPEYERYLEEHKQDEEYSAVAVSRYLSRTSGEGDSEEEEEDSDGGSGEEEEEDEIEPPKVLGDLLESLAGAIFMDSGMDLQAVWGSLGPLFDEKIEKFKDNIPMPAIKKLHELFDVDVKLNPAGQGLVCCTIKHRGTVVATERALSRKAAKNKAAKAALRKLTSRKNDS